VSYITGGDILWERWGWKEGYYNKKFWKALSRLLSLYYVTISHDNNRNNNDKQNNFKVMRIAYLLG
jgi:hypothetical protein